ncbi:MAG: hypothetical protein LCH84_15050 [Gemmatimonadetes bacterium]|nr:hypothetical protein [Gemmatimonadota bacterium]
MPRREARRAGHTRRALLLPLLRLLPLACGAALAWGCAEVGTGPDVPAAIEFAPFPSPAVVVGDTLRDATTGAVAGIQAIVRNLDGDPIDDASVRYLYANANRDTALRVDSLTGLVIGRAIVSQETRVAARVGSSLQVLRSLIVTTRPDTVVAGTAPQLLTTTLPDTGRARAQLNTTLAVGVLVQHRESATLSGVNGWIVRFEIVSPANPSNDTSSAVFLVNDVGTASVIDTTDSGGNAGRRLRVRASTFPVSGTDTVVVRASALYRGRVLPGSGVLLKAPVRRGGG